MHSHRRRLAALLFAGVGITAAAYGDTRGRVPEPLRVRIEEGSSPCIEMEGFYSEVTARTEWVRRAAGDEKARTVIVKVTADPSGGAEFTGSLQFEDSAQKTQPRIFHAATCDEALSAIALITALSIDPNAKMVLPQKEPVARPTGLPGIGDLGDAGPASRPQDAGRVATGAGEAGTDAASSSPAPTVRPEPDGSAEVDPPRTPARVPPKGASIPDRVAFEPVERWTFALGGTASAVILDSNSASATAAPGAFVEAGRNSARLFAPTVRLSAAEAWGSTVVTAYGSGTPRWRTLDASFCPIRLLARSLLACADVEAGALDVLASGQAATPRGHLWFAPGLLARLSWPALSITERISLLLDVEAGVRAPLLRPTFSFLDNPMYEVYVTPALVPHGAIDIGLRFW